MLSSRRVLAAVGCIVIAGFATPAWATIQNLKSYKAAYPDQDAKAYSCKACHENPVGKSDDLNAYGAALQQFKADTGAKALTEEDYQAFDEADLDEDGATNREELDAGTDLSDPASVPEGAEEPVSREPGSLRQLQAYLDALVVPSADAADDAPADEATSEGASTIAEAPEATYVGTETCAMCHAKEAKEFERSTHARTAIPGEDVKAQGCESCHGPGSLHVDAGGGKGVGIINPRQDPSTCFECHLDKKAEFRLPYHHPLIEGKMSCADCHNAHGEEVRPWSATTLNDINEACFRCHKEQRGPFVWEHEALREGCTTCHKVHGSIHEKMLLARDSNLCLRCHTQANFPTMGQRSHATYLPGRTCFSAGCHTAPHGSNFDDHLRY